MNASDGNDGMDMLWSLGFNAFNTRRFKVEDNNLLTRVLSLTEKSRSVLNQVSVLISFKRASNQQGYHSLMLQINRRSLVKTGKSYSIALKWLG